MGVCICYMFYCTLLYVHSSFVIILMWKRELHGCLVFFLVGLSAVVIVVFPDHTYLLFYIYIYIITLRCHILIKRVLHSKIEMLLPHPEINILT